MGSYLSQPIVEKHSSEGADNRLMYGASCMQGWRDSMEDENTTILKLEDKDGHSFFGVYDGHYGQAVATFAKTHLHENIAKEDAFNNKDYKLAIKNGFLATDDAYKQGERYRGQGCTAIAALITPDNRLFVGNAGDTRAILSASGKLKALSQDHKPSREEEQSRIKAAGGFVQCISGIHRTNGDLSLSRALGDFKYKKNDKLPPEEQIITADPEIFEHKITDEDEFIVLACDGIWDVKSSEDVIHFVRHSVFMGKNLSQTCESLMDSCIALNVNTKNHEIGCDNMTVIIIGILNGKTPEEWYDMIKKRFDETEECNCWRQASNSEDPDNPDMK